MNGLAWFRRLFIGASCEVVIWGLLGAFGIKHLHSLLSTDRLDGLGVRTVPRDRTSESQTVWGAIGGLGSILFKDLGDLEQRSSSTARANYALVVL
jgi:hypothetical protein